MSGNQRIKRVDSNNIDQVRTTWYFGNVERIVQDGGNAFFRRYVGGVATVEYYPGTQATNLQFLLKDHLGSISKAVTTSGVSSLKFTAFGQRATSTWGGVLGTSSTRISNIFISTRGFTGHEHADGLGIIHMNGRIYDPKLGRMLQADPFVQDPKNSQSLNRYSYVLNNPLSYTDPSGYFSLKSLWKKWLRPILAIAVITVGMIVAPELAFVWGALSGYISSGNITGALVGAFGAVGFVAIGGEFASLAGRTLASGAWGGFMSFLGGGKFGHGFVSAGFTQALSGRIGAIDANNAGFSVQRSVAAAIVGGTASELTGGKFANGAVTGAFSYAASDMVAGSQSVDANIANVTDGQPGSLSVAEAVKKLQEKGLISADAAGDVIDKTDTAALLATGTDESMATVSDYTFTKSWETAIEKMMSGKWQMVSGTHIDG